MNTKLIAIIAASIVVVAGVGAFVLIGGNDSDDDFKNYGGRLMVFGNANNDDFIDEDDIAVVKQIISDGVWDENKYPYADATRDGKVNEEDIKFIEKMIKRDPMTLSYINVAGEEKKIGYPIGNIVVIGSDSMRGMQILGLADKVVGRNGSADPNNYLDPTLNKTIMDNATQVSPSTSKIDVGLLSKLMDKTSVDVVVTTDTAFKDTEAAVEGLGPKVVRMKFSDESKGINSFLTFGYLANAEDKAKAVTAFLDKVQRNIDNKLSTLSEDKRVTAVMMAGGGGLYANTITTGYGSWAVKGGAINGVTPAMLDGADQKSVVKGDTWHLTKDFKKDFVVYAQGFNYSYAYKYSDQIHDDMDYFAGEWKKYIDRFSWDKMLGDNYQNGIVIINWNLYVPIASAYLASVFYPDLFGADYGDKVHQEFIDLFYPDLKNAGYTVDGHVFCVTYDQVKGHL